MKGARQSKLDGLVDEAWRFAGEWSERWATTLRPTPLEELAADLNVLRLEFEPLMSTAGLEREADGFVICVTPEADGANRRQGEAIEISEGNLSTLAPPMRFTVAHELVHLILLRLAGNNTAVFSGHEPRLEVVCNQIAGALLLPRGSVVGAWARNPFDVRAAKEFLAALRVSVDAFVLRLRSPDMSDAYGSVDGMMVILRKSNGAIDFGSAFVQGRHAGTRWEKFKTASDAATTEDLLVGDELISRILAEDKTRASLNVDWNRLAHQVIPSEVTSCRIHSAPMTVLIGISVAGEVRTAEA